MCSQRRKRQERKTRRRKSCDQENYCSGAEKQLQDDPDPSLQYKTRQTRSDDVIADSIN